MYIPELAFFSFTSFSFSFSFSFSKLILFFLFSSLLMKLFFIICALLAFSYLNPPEFLFFHTKVPFFVFVLQKLTSTGVLMKTPLASYFNPLVIGLILEGEGIIVFISTGQNGICKIKQSFSCSSKKYITAPNFCSKKGRKISKFKEISKFRSKRRGRRAGEEKNKVCA